MMHSPEYLALMELREALARERMALRDELKRRSDAVHAAEGEMWYTLGEPGGTEPYDAWKAAMAYRDELHPAFEDLRSRGTELSAKMKAIRDAERAADDLKYGVLP